MSLFVLCLLVICTTQQYCDTYKECDSCCDTYYHKCTTCTCTTSSDCDTGCCINGKCSRDQYCRACASHEECESKCCLQGNCYDSSYCPYYPIGLACSYNYQCVTYQCNSNICSDTVNTACSNHTDCATKCCFSGKCQLDSPTYCPAHQINMTCTNNWDCDTYLCLDNKCKASLTGKCYSHEDCESGCCKNSRCEALELCSKKAAQSDCVYSYECDSGRCVNMKCISRVGEICSNHSDCEYKCCKNEVCSLGCIYLKVGVPCLMNGDCSSYICKSGICVGSDGVICNDHFQCKSGFCKGSSCSSDFTSQKNLLPGQSCNYSYQCSNFFCTSNKVCLTLSDKSCKYHSECDYGCCVGSKCSLGNITDCNYKNYGYFNSYYNYYCKSNLKSEQNCLVLNGNYSPNFTYCASNCLVNNTCVNTSYCSFKNAGEKCSANNECVGNSCINGVCIGFIDDICVNRYNCEVEYSQTYSKTCSNHICKEVKLTNTV